MSAESCFDPYLRKYELNPRVARLREYYFQAMPEICIERPCLITKFCKNNNLFGKKKISIFEKAKMYRYVLENRTPIVSHNHAYESCGTGKRMRRFSIEDDSLFAGATTSKFKGVLLYPEFLAVTLWPELYSISTRGKNPYEISEDEAGKLNEEIFPYWMEETILERTRARCKDNGKDPLGISMLQSMVFFLASKTNCISHTIPDFSRAIKKGLNEIISDAKKKRDNAKTLPQKEFYAAIIEVLKGIVAYSRNLASKAQEMALKENNPSRKQELLDIARIYNHVPEFPARTFREGLTTVWVCWTAIHLENPNIGLSLGRLDQVLYDLYAKDINKTMTIEEALELICCLWLKIGDHVPMIPEAGEQLFGGTGSNQAITIGGVKADNNEKPEDAVNELTYVMLRATELMMLRDPNLNARYYSGVNKKEYLERICDANLTTKATPAIHNDKAVIKALMSRGETLEQARDYGTVGCVEPSSNGRAYTASASILLNLTSVLELTLYNGRHRHTGMDKLISKPTGNVADDPGPFQDFEQFKEAFKKQLEWMVDLTTDLNNDLGITHQQVYPTPILSALFEGPMDKGKDLIKGGAVINASGATIIGFADVADSLSAIEQVVYKDKKTTFPELFKALTNDYRDNPRLHKLLTEAPKYGREEPQAEANVQWLAKIINDAFKAKKTYRGGRYRVGYWTMTNHAGFGRLTKALPNGRKAHENFASGITPVSGATPVLTATLNDVAVLPAKYVTNGMAFNIKYTPEKDKKSMLKNFAAIVEGFFDDLNGQRDGGMEIQFNINDHRTFIDAVKHPEKYPELLVRVSGYTAYFRDLNPQMQKEIIERTEYDLAKGEMRAFERFQLPPRGKDIDLDWLGYLSGMGVVTDKLLEALLRGMDMAFWLSRGYRRNIKNFKGRYLFVTRDGDVAASAIFNNGDLDITEDSIGDWDVKVSFTDDIALLEFLLSQNQDVLNSLLENKVEVEGNLNYLSRFGYLAKDLENRVTGRTQPSHDFL